MNEDETECDCIACEMWHADEGEGLSIFCLNTEPLVIERGPNWKPPVNP